MATPPKKQSSFLTTRRRRPKNITFWQYPSKTLFLGSSALKNVTFRAAPKTSLFGTAPAGRQKRHFLAMSPRRSKNLNFWQSSPSPKRHFLAAPLSRNNTFWQRPKNVFFGNAPAGSKNVAFWWHFFARKASQRSPTCSRPLAGLRNAEDLLEVFSGRPPRGLQNPNALPEPLEVRKTFWRSSKCGRPSKGLRAARKTTTRFMTSRKLLKCTRHPKGSRTGLLAARKISWRSQGGTEELSKVFVERPPGGVQNAEDFLEAFEMQRKSCELHVRKHHYRSRNLSGTATLDRGSFQEP